MTLNKKILLQHFYDRELAPKPMWIDNPLIQYMFSYRPESANIFYERAR